MGRGSDIPQDEAGQARPKARHARAAHREGAAKPPDIAPQDADAHPEPPASRWPEWAGDNADAIRRAYQTIFDAIADPVMVIDRDHVVRYANRAALAQTPADQVGVPITCHQLSHRNPTPCTDCDCPRLAVERSGSPVSTIHEHYHQAGQKRVYEVTMIPVTNRQGELIEYVETTRDVTTRSRIQRRLQMVEQGIERSADAIFLTNLDGKITYVNPAFGRLYGYTAEEAVGSTPRLIKSGEHTAEEYRHLWSALLDKRVDAREMINRAKDGRRVVVESSVSPILDDRGGIQGFLALQRDITARKEEEQQREALQAQLRQAQKMEAVGRLASGIAHDFNNLLTVIRMFNGLAQNALPAESPARRDLEMAIKAALGAKDLIRQLLVFSRDQVAVPRELNLDDVVIETHRLLDRLIGENIDFRIQSTAGLWPVLVDPALFEQVLVNLVLNARDAMPDGGELSISTSNVTLLQPVHGHGGSTDTGDHVLLRVADSGSGMDAETLEHAFEPFFTTKEPTKGTGLGLSTVYGTVEQCGGTIAIWSKKGVGTTFDIYLPRHQTTGFKDHASPALGAQGDETILVVEDDDQLRHATARMLSSMGYGVLTARTAHEALEVFQRNSDQVALALIDLVLPDSAAVSLADRIRREHPQTRLLFTSGYPRETELPTAADFLPKPFSPDELATRIRESLDRQR